MAGQGFSPDVKKPEKLAALAPEASLEGVYAIRF
jgi:hypothetical protein